MDQRLAMRLKGGELRRLTVRIGRGSWEWEEGVCGVSLVDYLTATW